VANAESPHAGQLVAGTKFVSDWTVEAWFKDEDPNGFNHDYVTH
jgi:hypothetical protein